MTKNQLADKHGGHILEILASGTLVKTYRILSVGPTGSIGDALASNFERVNEVFPFIDRGTLTNFTTPPELEEAQLEETPVAASPEAVEGAEEGDADGAFAIEEDEDELTDVVLATAYLQVDDTIAEAGIHNLGPYVLGLDMDDLEDPTDGIDDLLRSIKEWSVANGHGKTLYFLFEGNLQADENLDETFNATEGAVTFVQTFLFDDLPYSVLSLEFES